MSADQRPYRQSSDPLKRAKDTVEDQQRDLARRLRGGETIYGENGEPPINLRSLPPVIPASACPIIAPVCATCGHEIDKVDDQWWHVALLPDNDQERQS